MLEIRRATTLPEVVAAEPLFDGPVSPDVAARFLAEPSHLLLLAYVGGDEPVGMISGVETTHPDKGTEMFLYELGVAQGHRRQGIGRALVVALAELARERGCYGMWVGVEPDDDGALATYRSSGSDVGENFVLQSWSFR